MFNMTFPCTTTMGATDPARCLTHHPPYPHHPSIHWRQSLNYQYRLCSFPSPPRFTKPCDIEDTDRPFCYTRIKEAGISFKTFFLCLFWNLLFTQRVCALLSFAFLYLVWNAVHIILFSISEASNIEIACRMVMNLEMETRIGDIVRYCSGTFVHLPASIFG